MQCHDWRPLPSTCKMSQVSCVKRTSLSYWWPRSQPHSENSYIYLNELHEETFWSSFSTTQNQHFKPASIILHPSSTLSWWFTVPESSVPQAPAAAAASACFSSLILQKPFCLFCYIRSKESTADPRSTVLIPQNALEPHHCQADSSPAAQGGK